MQTNKGIAKIYRKIDWDCEDENVSLCPIMRRYVLTFLFLSLIGKASSWAQRPMNTLNPIGNRDRYGNQIDPNSQPDDLQDSVEVQSLPPKVFMWKLSEKLGDRTIVPADTASLNFQNTNMVDGMTGHNN